MADQGGNDSRQTDGSRSSGGKSLAKRKKTAIDIKTKLAILDYKEKNPSRKQVDIAKHFDLPPQTVNNILNKKSQIRETAAQTQGRAGGSVRKRIRATQYEDVDAALILWFKQLYARPDIRVDGLMLNEKAGYFAKEFGYDSPPSSSWVDRWKKRWQIAKIAKCGEAGGVDMDSVNEWREGAQAEILAKYAPDDIFNCDETGLFWQMLPENSLGFIGEKQSGKKESKGRITLLVGSNMTGTEKMPLLAIGKFGKPRAFKHVQKLPVKYTANRKAWMVSSIFEDEMRAFDARMKLQSRKVAMIMDNCPAHPKIDLENVELVSLPPNTTSITQPMDSGIIRNLKFYYRRILANRRLDAAEKGTPFKWDMLDCLFACKTSWQSVKPDTIKNCWRKAGFRTDEQDEPLPDAGGADDAEDEQEFRNIWDRLGELVGELPDFSDYADMDDQTEDYHLIDKEIVDHVKTQNLPAPVDEPDSESAAVNETDNEPPTMHEAIASLNTLRRFIVTQDIDQEDILLHLGKFEQSLLAQNAKKAKQSKITDFFKL